MTTFQLLSLLASIAAVFVWVSSRWLRLPITIGTMLLTVGCSLGLMGVSAYAPGLQLWATGLVRQIDFESLILHGMLGCCCSPAPSCSTWSSWPEKSWPSLCFRSWPHAFRQQ